VVAPFQILDAISKSESCLDQLATGPSVSTDAANLSMEGAVEDEKVSGQVPTPPDWHSKLPEVPQLLGHTGGSLDRRLRDLTSVFYPSSPVSDVQQEARDTTESSVLRSRTPPDSSGTNPPALAALEEQETLDEIRFYTSLSWDTGEALLAGVTAIAIESSMEGAAEVESHGGSRTSDEDGELEQPSLLLPKTPHPGTGPTSHESKGREEAESEEDEEEMRFEMVLDMDAEELVGREEEFKTELIRDLSRSVSMRPIERAADRMARALLATPSATPYPKQQKIQRLKLDAEEATLENQAALSSPSGAGANDNGRELHAFQVRGLVLEQTSVIVELSWSPFQASRALAQEREQELSARSVAVHPNIGKENDALEDIELQNEGTNALAEIPSQREAFSDLEAQVYPNNSKLRKIPSQGEVFSDLEAQVYSNNSKLRNGLFSRHVTGISMPLLLKTPTSTPRKRVTILETQSRGTNSSNTSSSAQRQGSSLSSESSPSPPAMSEFELERGSEEGRPESLGRVDFEAPYLVQRCALMKVTSLQEQVLYLLMFSVR
jgi:hypothetical protein